MLFTEAVEPGKESETWYDCTSRPDADTLKLTLSFAVTVVPGESEVMESDAASANAAGIASSTIARPPPAIRVSVFIGYARSITQLRAVWYNVGTFLRT